MKKNFIIGSVILAVSFFILMAGKSTADPPLKIEPRSPIISPRLADSLNVMSADDKIKVWIFFTDKGIFDNQALKRTLESIENNFTQRAVTRRKNRTDNPELFDFYDIPVNDEYVRQLESAGVEILRRSRWLNAVAADIDKELLSEIASYPFIYEIKPVAVSRRKPAPPDSFRRGDVLPDSVIEWYGLSYTQLNLENIPVLHQFGYTGEGVLVAMLDAGFELSHPAFSDITVIDQYDFVDDDPIAKDPDNTNENRHGTLVLSIIGGYVPDNLIGSAYGAEFLLARTELVAQEIIEEEHNWVAAAEWADQQGADIISTSLGYLDWYEYSDLDGNTAPITIAADLAVSRGIAVFSSAGNERSSEFHYITPPSDGDSVIAVGSVNSLGIIANSSSAGPTYDGRVKPEILAMGVGVYGASYTGGYTYANGTSMAAPIAAGAGAILLQAYPEWSPVDLREAMIRSGDRYDNPDTVYGYGLLDAFEASQLFYINPVEPIIIAVGDTLDVTFSVTGLQDSIPAFYADNIPSTAVFEDNGDRTAGLYYIGISDDIGLKTFQIVAQTGSAMDMIDVSLTVLAQGNIAVGPNPFDDTLAIFIGPDNGQITDITIHTPNGEKVWQDFTDSYNMTTSTVVWNGRNSRGSEVGSGVYFVVVRTERTVKKFKVFKR